VVLHFPAAVIWSINFRVLQTPGCNLIYHFQGVAPDRTFSCPLSTNFEYQFSVVSVNVSNSVKKNLSSMKDFTLTQCFSTFLLPWNPEQA